MFNIIDTIENFDPDKISASEMKDLAIHLESYLNMYENFLYIPDELKKEISKNDVNEAIQRTKKLIKKLRHGDRSVFKNSD